jgi:glycosyltransferase involved in cell wall biosynthesis
VQRLGRLLAVEHEVTVIHSDEGAAVESGPDDPPGLRHLVADRSRLPPAVFACDDHAHSAATLLAIEDTYGDDPPGYLEVPDYRGHGLVPLQARNAGHRSLRGCVTAVRLRGMAEPIRLQDDTWSPPQNRIVFDLEREALRLADLVLWPGGDVLTMYERYLGPALPRNARRLRLPVEQPQAPPDPEPRATEAPLRILYAGRFQRVKGVLPLVEACAQIEGSDWHLTMIGGDTDTAPLNWSMRATIETMCVGDERVSLHDPLPRDDLQRAFSRYDLLAVPSHFEVWANVALEAMRAGLPVLASPVGGLTEIVADGVTGWHADATPAALANAIRHLLTNRNELESVRASGEIFRRFQQLTDPQTVLAEYRDLLHGLRPPIATTRPLAASRPLVTGIVPYHGEHEWVADAVRSLLEQTHDDLEVTIVNDGSFDPEDGVLDELAEEPRVRVLTQTNQGDNAARNLGILDADGEYLVMLDSDNAFEPEFVERAVAMLEADSDLAYVTCWLRFVGEPAALEAIGTQIYPPLGNAVRSDDEFNSDGDTMAVLPRRLFADLGYGYQELGMAGDWELYRQLREDGRYGAVIPELLGRYRVRSNSISRAFAEGSHDPTWGEALSRRRLRSLR